MSRRKTRQVATPRRLAATARADQAVTAEEVRVRLRRFNLSKPALEQLYPLLDTREKLDRIYASLETRVQERLGKHLDELAGNWSHYYGRGFKNGLYIAQAIVGPDLLHPAFAETAKPLIEQDPQALRPVLAKLLGEVGAVGSDDRPYLKVDADGNLCLSSVGKKDETWQSITVGQLRHGAVFWQAFARRLIEQSLNDEPESAEFPVGRDIGALILFANRLSELIR